MKKSPLEKKKKVGCEAELIWIGDERPPAASKVSLLIRDVRFAAKANTEGSFTVSAVHGILALVSVTLGQSHLYPLPWGFSLGGLGFFWTLRRFSSEGTCASKMPAVFSWVSVYVCLFGVLVLRYLSAFSERPQGATFRTFKDVIRSLYIKGWLREPEEQQFKNMEYEKERCSGQKTKVSKCDLVFEYRPKLEKHAVNKYLSEYYARRQKELKIKLKSEVPREFRAFSVHPSST